jgi:hypothetical protein
MSKSYSSIITKSNDVRENRTSTNIKGNLTWMMRGSTKTGSTLIKLDHLIGVKIGKMIEGEGIDENSFIVSMNDEQNEIEINYPVTQDASNVTFFIKETSTMYIDNVEEYDSYYEEEFISDDE